MSSAESQELRLTMALLQFSGQNRRFVAWGWLPADVAGEVEAEEGVQINK